MCVTTCRTGMTDCLNNNLVLPIIVYCNTMKHKFNKRKTQPEHPQKIMNYYLIRLFYFHCRSLISYISKCPVTLEKESHPQGENKGGRHKDKRREGVAHFCLFEYTKKVSKLGGVANNLTPPPPPTYLSEQLNTRHVTFCELLEQLAVVAVPMTTQFS